MYMYISSAAGVGCETVSIAIASVTHVITEDRKVNENVHSTHK
jgi:hypothetical protein